MAWFRACTTQIITGYMSIARQPEQNLLNQNTKTQQQLAAWQDLNTRVLALQTDSNSIASVAGFQAKTATSSQPDIVGVTASTDATAGTYYVTVDNTAKSHQIASQTFSGLDSAVGSGTIKVTLDSTTVDINIDSSNNTLVGVKDAINKANAGVTASVVNQGTTSNPQYSLILTSNQTGTDHKMIVDAGTTGLQINSDQDGNGDRTLVQAAGDAEIMLGSLKFTRSSNSISDIIPGITLNLSNADPKTTVKIDISQDTQSAKTAVRNFVNQYNDIMTTIKNDTSYRYADREYRHPHGQLRDSVATNGPPKRRHELGLRHTYPEGQADLQRAIQHRNHDRDRWLADNK